MLLVILPSIVRELLKFENAKSQSAQVWQKRVLNRDVVTLG